MHDVHIRPVEPADAAAWVALRTELWPRAPADHAPEVGAFLADPPSEEACLVAETSQAIVGFVEVGLRKYAEECTTSPVGYLEGIYVSQTYRGRGIGRALVEAAESWARDRGCSEMASDRALTNEESGRFHLALGFNEVHRIVCYRKKL